MSKFVKCSIASCESNAHWSGHGCNGYCYKHNYRLQQHGDPLGGRTAPGVPRSYFNDVVLAFDGDECLFWPYAKNSAGYGHFRVNGSTNLAHRLACEAENGPPPSDLHEAAHECGNGHLGCCNKKHVSWKTRSGNVADMVAHGRSQLGERHYGAKLTDDAVREIRSCNLPNNELAAIFNVTPSNIMAVRRMKTWRHIQ